MQVTQLRLVGATTVNLPWFSVPEGSKFVVKSVDGLGPSERTVFISEKTYQGKTVSNRQVVILLDLYPDWTAGETPSDLRDDMYAMLAPGLTDALSLRLMNGEGVQAQVDAVASGCEIVPFSKDPVLQITLDCLSPYFKSPTSWSYGDANFGGLKTGYVVPNLGNAETGFAQEITFTAGLASWALYKGGAGLAPKFQLDYAFLSGDVLQINTTKYERYVRRVRSGVTLDLLPYLTQDSKWLQLHAGNNTFWTSSQSFNWGTVIQTPLYEGV